MVYHQQNSTRVGWKRFLAIDPLWFDEHGVIHTLTTRGKQVARISDPGLDNGGNLVKTVYFDQAATSCVVVQARDRIPATIRSGPERGRSW